MTFEHPAKRTREGRRDRDEAQQDPKDAIGMEDRLWPGPRTPSRPGTALPGHAAEWPQGAAAFG
ncbi:hypothetical protein [Streptomyces sp. NPDC059708]|uniref:hypothetical protein n=1 Tax=Streptomyces sp. NPDC059708 TaxID=3346916 RepID=UPI0036AAE85D